MADESAAVFAHVARVLAAAGDYDATLVKVTELAVESIEGCDHACINLARRGGRIETVAATDETATAVDRIQQETDQGPCLSTIREAETITVDDLRTDHRWPTFSRRAVEEVGILSLQAIRLFVEVDTIGALNLYSRRRAAFDRERSLTMGALFAAHASVAMSAARTTHDLESALLTRGVIARAQGILMSSRGMTSEQAFDELRTTSQHLNIKLREVAEDVNLTGEIPQVPG